jgi:AcrR family transcriptional regulator
LLEVFVREGYARASVDVIAQAAAVSKRTIYDYYGDKEGLFLSAVKETAEARGGVGVAIIGSRALWWAAAGRDGNEVALRYRVRGTPSAVLVDVGGRVAAPVARGPIAIRAARLRQKHNTGRGLAVAAPHRQVTDRSV